MNYLGVDYGLKKIGLAYSEGSLATPLKIVKVSSLQNALDLIVNLMSQYQIGQVIIGLPESGQIRKAVEKFTVKLSKEVSAPIIHHPETLSSQTARAHMIAVGKSKKTRKQEDSFSAMVILQDYLDSQK